MRLNYHSQCQDDLVDFPGCYQKKKKGLYNGFGEKLFSSVFYMDFMVQVQVSHR